MGKAKQKAVAALPENVSDFDSAFRKLKGAKRQGYFWRYFSLFQMIATFWIVIFTIFTFFFADTVVDLQPALPPRHYPLAQIPDDDLINFSTGVVNLVATYQPATARIQFDSAKSYLAENSVADFESYMEGKELSEIESTHRSQIFMFDPRTVSLQRSPDNNFVKVMIPGAAQRLIGPQVQGVQNLLYTIVISTTPRNVANEYGLVAAKIESRTYNPKKST